MTVTPQMLARSAALGVAGAALSARDQGRLLRGIGLATAAGVGASVAWRSRSPQIEGQPTDEGAIQPAPLPVALGLGVGTTAAVAAMSEIGIRGQAWVEDWAERTVGHPRLVIGVGTAAIMLVMEVVEQRLDAQ